MNIENVAALGALLSRAGFENLSYRLLQHICCQPLQFVLREQVMIGSDRVSCELNFERKAGDYTIAYYDAALMKPITVPEATINHVSLLELEAAMKTIEWKKPEDPATFRISDETTWVREKEIARIVNDLTRLSATAQGKVYADALKVWFWSGTWIEDLNGSLAALRAKLEISQRFYFMDGDVIPVFEAVKFLLNRWIQKKMAAIKKAESSDPVAEANSGGRQVGLHRKQKVGRTRKIEK